MPLFSNVMLMPSSWILLEFIKSLFGYLYEIQLGIYKVNFRHPSMWLFKVVLLESTKCTCFCTSLLEYDSLPIGCFNRLLSTLWVSEWWLSLGLWFWLHTHSSTPTESQHAFTAGEGEQQVSYNTTWEQNEPPGTVWGSCYISRRWSEPCFL